MSETTTSQSHAAQHAPHEPPRRRHWLLAAGWPRAAWMTGFFFLLGVGIVVGLRALGGFEPPLGRPPALRGSGPPAPGAPALRRRPPPGAPPRLPPGAGGFPLVGPVPAGPPAE